MKEFDKKFSDYKKTIEDALDNYLKLVDCSEKTVLEAARYSLLAGGKRFRPILMLDICTALGADANAAVPFACALEMIHTYSLIHDDLPCMDNDDLRRGRPTNHVVYGEANALLAGDALLTYAFSMVKYADKSIIKPEVIIKCIQVLADCAGIFGMIGGQVIDLENEGKKVSYECLLEMHSKKTGALIKAACVIGALCAGADEKIVSLFEEYAYNLGMAFQITDDILDVEGDVNTLGKNTGGDYQNQKSTFVTILGLEESKKQAEIYVNTACNLLKNVPNSQFLSELTIYLLNRNN